MFPRKLTECSEQCYFAGSDDADAACLGPAGEAADGSRCLGGGGDEAARGRPVCQPYDTAPEWNAAGLLGWEVDPANRQHH